MAEKIEVGYSAIGFNGSNVYHKYLIYTDSNGNQFYSRGGPGYIGPGAQHGGRNEYSNSPIFGNIKTESGEYKEGTPDWDPARDPDPSRRSTTDIPDPRETILETPTGSLSDTWQDILGTMGDIDNENYPYHGDQNSNTTVDNALSRNGLPEPVLDDRYWSPGSGRQLSGGIHDPVNPNVPPPRAPLPDNLFEFPSGGMPGLFDPPIGPIRDSFNNASRTVSPLILDHDGDGIKTGTGWLKPNDGWLVLDRNNNNLIDSGKELFGVDTVKSNGEKASDGFDALKDFDLNSDGKIDSTDEVFAKLRVWQDLNQDGISQSNELTTLEQNHIIAIGVNSTETRINLGNGNVQTAAGSFTRDNGSTGQTGETAESAAANLDLLVNTFYRHFTDAIPLNDQARNLPTLTGSGQVRDLSEATLVGRISYLRNPPNKKLSINDEIYSWQSAA